jgi:hypothetical protein
MARRRFFFWQQESAYSRESQDKLEAAIKDSELSAAAKEYLRTRWLRQVTWWEMRAAHSRTMFHSLRVIGLFATIVVTALAGIAVATDPPAWIRWSTVILGAIASISVGVETIFQFGDTWREKRRVVEKLKVEGWRFLSGVEPYNRESKAAFGLFAAKVETIIEGEIDQYIEAIREDETRPVAGSQRIDLLGGSAGAQLAQTAPPEQTQT